jgi:PTH1 family peptidyl-tRNA hydrolase
VHGGDTTVFLIKPLTNMNAIGPSLVQLSRQLGFDAADCILVQDDIDLPLGAVRVRTAGSDGGHRGVRSILQAFGTDTLRRVKIGVRRPAQTGENSDFVVQTFAPIDLPVIARACVQAAERTLGLLGRKEDCS